MKRIIRTFLLTVVPLVAWGAPLTPSIGAPRRIEPHFLGFNQNFMGQTDPWDQRLISQLKTTGGSNFRYPAGTVGTYWNWRTGRVDETLAPEDVMTWVKPHAKGGANAGRGRYTLENLKAAVQGASIVPVFMLGLTVHDIREQVSLLKYAESIGLPVRYLELGNEVIFKDAEPLLERKFPDAETYGRVASEWVSALRQAFPQAKIAACGSFVASDSQSERRRLWNPKMMTTLKGTNIITTHLYAGEIVRTERERLGLSEVQAQQALNASERNTRDIAANDENAPRAIGLAYEVWDKLLAKTKIPEGMEIWVTEWSTGGVGGAGDRWQTALVTAALLDAFLRTNVTLTCHHTMGAVFRRAPNARRGANNPGDGGETTDQLNATGIALHEFSLVMNGRTMATEISFPQAPIVQLSTGRRFPSVVGWNFGKADATGSGDTIVLNLGATEQIIEATSLNPTGGKFRQLAGPPDSDPSTLKPMTGDLGPTLVLPPFSLTIIQKVEEISRI